MSAPSAAPAELKTATGAHWTLRVTVTVLALLFVVQGLTGGEYLVGKTWSWMLLIAVTWVLVWAWSQPARSARATRRN